jgi:cell division septation protein DedD
VAAVAPPPQATAAPSGSVHLQVAAVRSRDEAYALAVRLTSQYGSQLGLRRPQVDQTVIGSMGTFYRVRVGPFASAHDSEPLCGAIRSSGFDCLVITQ